MSVRNVIMTAAGALGGAAGQFLIERSLQFNGSNSYTQLYPTTSGNTGTWTFSAWVKRSALGTFSPIFSAGPLNPRAQLNFNSSDKLQLRCVNSAGSETVNIISTAVFRDPSAWYHVVAHLDTSNATSSDRAKIYVNGVRIETFDTATYPSQYANNFSVTRKQMPQCLGVYIHSPADGYFSGYIAEAHLVQDSALTPSSFGEFNSTTGVWSPIEFSGTHGPAGFYLNFDDTTSPITLGEDKTVRDTDIDLNWNKTSILLNGNGTNGAQNNTFADSSNNNLTITRNGNTTQGTFSPFSSPDGAWSNYFDGAGDSLAAPNNSAFDMTGTSYCFELWAYITSDSKEISIFNRFDGTGGPGLSIQILSDGRPLFSTGDNLIADTDVPEHTWTHLAFTFDGTTKRLFINGKIVASTTSGSMWSNSVTNTSMVIGKRPSDGRDFDYEGYMSNVRIVKGSAVYTSNFTPSTEPLTAISGTSLLTCQSNRFVDNGTANSGTGFTLTVGGDPKVTPFSPFAPTAAYDASVNGGSGYFDGNDYLEIADSDLFYFDQNRFTVEGWIYRTSSAGSYQGMISQWIGGGSRNFQIGVYNGLANAYVNIGGTNYMVEGGSVNLHEWTHLALVRDGSRLSLYKNGLRTDTRTDLSLSSNNSTGPIRIGDNQDLANFLTGYISNVRVVKNVAVYDPSVSSLTVPSALLSTVTGTSLLCNFTNAGIIDATGKSVLETVGTTQIDTTITKFGSGAIEFDGNSDYLINPKFKDPIFELDSGDFTIEGWFYNRSVSVNSGITYLISVWGITGQADGTFSQFVFRMNNGNLELVLQPTGGASLTSITGTGLGVVQNRWHHLAAVRSGSLVTLYVDGVRVGGASYTATLNNPNSRLVIGAQLQDGGGALYYFNGFMDDVRISKVAKYSGNFNPPTQQFAHNLLDESYNQFGMFNLRSDTQTQINYADSTLSGSQSLVNFNNTTGVSTFLGVHGGVSNGRFFSAFDGDLTTAVAPDTGGGNADNFVQFTPATGISYNSLVRVRVYAANGYGITNTYSLNGGAEVTFVGGDAGFNNLAWITVATGSGTLNSIKIRLQRTSIGSRANLAAIEVDGQILRNFIATSGDAQRDSPLSGGTDTGAGGEVRGNYATLNPLAKGTNVTVSNGNLNYTAPNSAGAYGSVLSTIGVTSGKWYAEYVWTSGSTNSHVGIATGNINLNTWLANNATGYSYYADGRKFNNGGAVAYGASYTNGDVIGVAFDADAGTLTFYKNNVSQGTAFTGLTNGPYFFGIGMGENGQTATINFGQFDFVYTAPSGFKALVTTNLPTPTVVQGDEYFDTVIWTADGNGATGDRVVTGINMADAPDMIWSKTRNFAYHNNIYDSVRGFGLNNALMTDLTLAEGGASGGRVKSSNTTSITWEAGGSGAQWYNETGKTYVSWLWSAGDSTVTNTAGAIPAQVRANPTAGFSIVTFTGTASNQAVGHGLGITPVLFIVKSRASGNWWVYTTVIDGSLDFLSLNTTNAAGNASQDAPTSTVFYHNQGDASVAYCFAPVAGYSAFGKYIGNGSADGPFVYTGFRPAFVILKAAINRADSWVISDNKRSTYNPNDKFLNAHRDLEEGNNNIIGGIDYLSNGFKCRHTDSAINLSGATYIYMAFAESPFKHALAR